ncbi:MAG TPA: hypothetical protein ENN90_00415 [Mariniphaga anaerophila]|uniref:DUF5017 domain-containing protein n=1 Tax=Mariniphaga anaerophila TaxID=1484053 RepID=A0A831LIC6_9BACT|nr:hypothetical protein [Mariniphaga anaerophila]
MKIKIFNLSVIILLLSFISAGCQKDDIFELDIGDENAVILKEIDGIEFKFCLLNEQGKPATVFDEGENFTFLFAIKNNRSESLPFYDYGYYELNDFLAVKSNGKSHGRPFIFKGYSTTLELKWLRSEVSDDLSYKFMVPWHDERDEWQLYWGFFESTKQPFLEKGEYYTQFVYNFSFGLPDKEPKLETGLISFKINFKIK